MKYPPHFVQLGCLFLCCQLLFFLLACLFIASPVVFYLFLGQTAQLRTEKIDLRSLSLYCLSLSLFLLSQQQEQQQIVDIVQLTISLSYLICQVQGVDQDKV